MQEIKFELNRAGVRELLKSGEMKDICNDYAKGALARLGEGYAADSHEGKNRVNAMVYAETYQAKRENAKTNSILKAIRG